ncbi:MAG: protein-L-isoaspartate O-methyltransferase [Rubrivivax sp.]|uniref:protein-L-isoaspartate O-methyltransferase family protein n=1 Tax=Ottowia sp. TaxID=1898956 RepID=UPI0021789ED4|nr:protein-L-isoaspartate O-methyltransferase [Ottowia sp.]MCC6812675.1 protein-L-isoaspartate O-methyltransferase [Rubrivivax sp.]MCZ2090310.1 protein-L-isoaspartate O-methyltransferase [Burkholderiales bacterium]HNI85144.1 protein-L-isoaspartate O-methyltransferase [Ottowia sp.]HNN34249.1 protein-L-isoaspartate O-methyltransferase [Ottowia sp.]HNO43542.1 protein-L-isoaspartate O-methyltransferase [Ottowia sp.]
MNVEQARFNMIEQQIRPWDVLDAHVLDLLAAVRREDFVPPAHRALAFADLEIPLKPGEQAVARGQVMLAPRVEARMLQDLQVAKHEKVLEIGTGSGFMAALLGHRAQRVLSLEIDDELARTAHANLQRAGVLNVEVRALDGARTDLSAHGPFDVIVLSGSVAELPDALLALLKPGGRLMAIVGHEPVMRATLVLRTDNGLVSSQPWDSNAPRLCHFPEPSRFQF